VLRKGVHAVPERQPLLPGLEGLRLARATRAAELTWPSLDPRPGNLANRGEECGGAAVEEGDAQVEAHPTNGAGGTPAAHAAGTVQHLDGSPGGGDLPGDSEPRHASAHHHDVLT
jgi:hypothetical protein